MANCNKMESAVEKANWLQEWTVQWAQPLISLGSQKTLEDEDIWGIAEEDSSLVLMDEKFCKQRRFRQAVILLCRRSVIKSAVLFMIALGLLTLQPLLVRMLLEYIENKSDHNPYAMVSMMGMVSLLAVTIINFGFYTASRIGIKMRSITMNLVYEKALKLNAMGLQASSSGKMVTLMSADAERMFEGILICNWVWMGPLAILVSQSLVANELGLVPAAVGTLVMVLIVFMSFMLGSKVGKLRSVLVKLTEKRLRVTTEFLQGIRIVKYYAWENFACKKIQNIRDTELGLLFTYHCYRVFNVVALFLSLAIVSAATFSTYVLLGNELNVTTAFTALTLINISRIGVARIPKSVSAVSELFVAMKRIQVFLDLPELPKSETALIDNVVAEKGAIQLQDASFTWTGNLTDFSLKQISLHIQPGQLVMVAGKVASGKSSLLSALLGEMVKAGGLCQVIGKCAYASQVPWIRSQTLKENIVFDDPYDERKYLNVLDAAQLLSDGLPDEIQIGEKGITVSGGQKARIALARAFYHTSADILIMDDPLSAIDTQAANNVFHVGINGLAKAKTRILVVSSHYHLLEHADVVIVMNDGRVEAFGTYETMQERYQDMFDESTPVEKELPSAFPVSKRTRNENLNMVEKQVEDRMRGAVTYATYFDYFGQLWGHGAILLIFILFLFAAGQTLRLLVDWYIGFWAKDSELNGSNTNSHIYYFVGLVGAATIAIMGRSYMFIYLTMKCSKRIHFESLQSVLEAKVPTFYDVTPMGQVINRFAQDLHNVDSILPDFFLQYLQHGFFVISAIIISCVSSPWIVLAYTPIVVLFVLLKRYFEKSSREIKRLEGVSRSPVFASFNETLSGMHTIRGYGRQGTFISAHRRAVDRNTRHFFAFWVTARWLAVRLDWLSAVIVTMVSTVVILAKDSMSPALAGLALTYSLMLTTILQVCVRVANQTENTMTSVERLLYFKTLDTENTRNPGTLVQKLQHGDISFNDVKMRYRPSLPLVLQGISFRISSGQKVG